MAYVGSQIYSSNKQRTSSLLPKPTRTDRINKLIARRTSKQIKSTGNLQMDDVIRQIGVSNLTSKTAREQFFKCPAISIMKTFHGHIPPSHQHCKKMSFQSSGPTVALGSFPGSGNSWVRQLLESATGIYTGSVYCDRSYIQAGMIGESVSTGNVIVVKIHAAPDVTKKLLNHDKAIYIVRSPFGALLSEKNRRIGKKVASKNKSSSSLGQSHTFEANPKYGML